MRKHRVICWFWITFLVPSLLATADMAFGASEALADDFSNDGSPNISAGPGRSENQPKPERIALWPDDAPLGNGEHDATGAHITVYQPTCEASNRPAIVICPGGGYEGLVVGPEGHGIAKWLTEHEMAAIVLEYRLPHGRPFVPLLDAQRAIRKVRSSCGQWNIDPGKVGVMGFSAGGHLASTLGTHFDRGDPEAADPVDRMSCRPDFMVLVYPVITMGERTHSGSRNNLLGRDPKPELVQLFSNERQVTNGTPRTFLAHAMDDVSVVPENSQMFYDALQVHNVAAEYVRLPNGGHGLHGYQGAMWDTWQTKCLEWLSSQKILLD